MDVITNKEVNVYLDNEKGTLCSVSYTHLTLPTSLIV